MAALTPDEHDPSAFQVDWAALKAGRNPWKRAGKIAVDPFPVAKAVKEVMRLCPNRTATGEPLVWNDYSVFLDIADWTRIKKLEGTLVRDLGGVVEKELAGMKAEMVGPLNVRLLRDESGNVRPGGGVVKADFTEARKLAKTAPTEMTVRIGKPAAPSLTDLPTERVPEMALTDGGSALRVQWERGSATVTSGT